MVDDAFVPSTQHTAGGLLDDGLLGICSSECIHVAHRGAERNGGELHLVAVVATQQAGAAEAGNLPEMLAANRWTPLARVRV
jgi:hypothetical protein